MLFPLDYVDQPEGRADLFFARPGLGLAGQCPYNIEKTDGKDTLFFPERMLQLFKKFVSSFLSWFVLSFLVFIFFISLLTLKPVFSFTSLIFVFLLIFQRSRLRVLGSKLINLLHLNNPLPFILLLAFVLRLLWVILIPTNPISDFDLMYKSAQTVQQGNFSVFHNYEYFARFSHDTMTVLYYSLYYNLTSNPLAIIKLVNVLFSTLAVLFMYKIVKQLYSREPGLVASFLLAIYPPFVMYNSQTMSENLALPFYLISIYYFLLFSKAKPDSEQKIRYLCFCGLALSAANMFRMVGVIFLIAYISYFVIYKGIRKSIFTMPVIFAGYLIPMYLISSLLITNGITETHLWKSKEPYWTSILKGTNFASVGHWNPEDAKLPELYNYDPDQITQAAKQIIKQRLGNASAQELSLFYAAKLGAEWASSEMSAYYWTVPPAPDTPVTNTIRKFEAKILNTTTLFYLSLLYFGILSLIKNKLRHPEEIDFFAILLCGFILLYLITEAQGRYVFIISWIFVIFAAGGLRATVGDVQPAASLKHNLPNA